MPIQRPTWFDKPESVLISVAPECVKMSPLGNEASIYLVNDDITYSAVVPRDAIDENAWKVGAAKVGEVGDNVLISFPPTSMGTATWSIEKSKLSSIISTA